MIILQILISNYNNRWIPGEGVIIYKKKKLNRRVFIFVIGIERTQAKKLKKNYNLLSILNDA